MLLACVCVCLCSCAHACWVSSREAVCVPLNLPSVACAVSLHCSVKAKAFHFWNRVELQQRTGGHQNFSGEYWHLIIYLFACLFICFGLFWSSWNGPPCLWFVIGYTHNSLDGKSAVYMQMEPRALDLGDKCLSLSCTFSPSIILFNTHYQASEENEAYILTEVARVRLNLSFFLLSPCSFCLYHPSIHPPSIHHSCLLSAYLPTYLSGDPPSLSWAISPFLTIIAILFWVFSSLFQETLHPVNQKCPSAVWHLLSCSLR